jgi:hypothetical protein
MRTKTNHNSVKATSTSRESRNKKAESSEQIPLPEIDHAMLAKLRCDWIRVKVYLPDIDVSTIGAETLFENMNLSITDFEDFVHGATGPQVTSKLKSGQYAAGGGRRATSSKRAIHYRDLGIYIELNHFDGMVVVEFQGRFWTLAAKPWDIAYSVIDYFKSFSPKSRAQVSRIDINRHFIGKPLELFPDPMSPRYHFSFLREGTMPIQIEGNLYLQRSETSVAQIYQKTKQIVKKDADIQEKFALFLQQSGVPTGCAVSRFEVSIKGSSKAIKEASDALMQKQLGSEDALQRIFLLWVDTHRVLEAPAGAQSVNRTRNYRKKVWELSKVWEQLTKGGLSSGATQQASPVERVVPETRPAKERDNLEYLVRRVASAALKKGIHEVELHALVSKALLDVCSLVAKDLVARDMASRLLEDRTPEECMVGDALPAWLAQLLRPQAAILGGCITRESYPMPVLQTLIDARKKARIYPYCKSTLDDYRKKLEKLLMEVHKPCAKPGSKNQDERREF